MFEDYFIPNGLSANAIEQRKWYDLVGKLRDKTDEFTRLYNDILAKAPSAKDEPGIIAEYNRWVKRAKSVKNSVSSLTGKVNTAVNYLKSMVGIDGVDQIGHMGFISIIPMAVIAASIVLLTKIISDGYVLNKKLDAVQQLRSQGYKPDEVTRILKNIGNESFLAPIKKIIPMLAAGGVALLIISQIEKR